MVSKPKKSIVKKSPGNKKKTVVKKTRVIKASMKCKPKLCSNCNKEYTPWSTAQKYCSDDCKKAFEKPTVCTCCLKPYKPWTSKTKVLVCPSCKKKYKKTCEYCNKTFYHTKSSRKFCGLACSGAANSKLAIATTEGPQFDLLAIADELIPLIQRDCTLQEACEHTGWSYSSVRNYLYSKKWSMTKYPEIKEFRRLIRSSRNYIKIISRKTITTNITQTKDPKLASDLAKFVISNRDKRYQKGHDENGNSGTGSMVVKFAAGKSPFIKPEDDLSGKQQVEENFDN